MKFLVYTWAAAAIFLYGGLAHAEENDNAVVEQTTESPAADVSIMGDAMKTASAEAGSVLKALRPRTPEIESGKQAALSSTTASPWQLFPFNAAQGLGSSVSSLADSVTGWLGNRIQLPGLVETPVRESATATTSVRPDVIIRVKQRAPTKKPLKQSGNNNKHSYRKTKKPNRFNGNSGSNSDENYDTQDYDNDGHVNRKQGYRKRYQEEREDDDEEIVSSEHEEDEGFDNSDEEQENEEEEEEEDEEEPVRQQNNKRKWYPKPMNSRKTSISKGQRKRNQALLHSEESAEENQYNDDDDMDFYYNHNHASRDSQNELHYIQQGPQSLLNQIKYLTRGQTPAQIGNSLLKKQKSTNAKRRQQATLLVNRNGQTLYVAPELLQLTEGSNTNKKHVTSQYPQPPLTKPYRRRGQPTQYITIPWSQLGISPPDQIVSLAEGIQSQPLILKIPQSAIDSIQNPGSGKKKTSITANAVPLLAEASIMDIFKPSPAHSPTTNRPNKKSAGLVIATKYQPATGHKRSDATVEKTPIDDKKITNEAVEDENKSSQFFVIGDELSDANLSRSAYAQILNYLNQNRQGRQAPLTTVSQTKEQLIPVHIVFGEEALKQGTSISDESEGNTKSSGEKNFAIKQVEVVTASSSST